MVETGIVEIGCLTLESGVVLDQVHLAYEWARKEDAPTVLVCHALVIGSEAQPDWWNGLIGVGKSIDTDKFSVISFNVLSGCGGSTGPVSINQQITIRDRVRAERQALSVLGIQRLHTIIGGSLGGLRVLEWGIMYADDMDVLIPIAVAPSLDTLNTHDIGRGRGGIKGIVKHIKAKTIMLGFTNDLIYPPETIRTFAHLLPNSSFCLMNTAYGHDGFLMEYDKWGPFIRQFMEVAAWRQSKSQYLASVR